MNDSRDRWYRAWCAAVFVSAFVSVPVTIWALCMVAPHFDQYKIQIERDLKQWTP